MARDRRGYARGYTRREILQRPGFGGYADPVLMGHVVDFTIDGQSVGDVPVRVRQQSRHEDRMALKDIELEGVSRALVHLGFRNVSLRSGERPDLRATFADRNSVGIEFSEIDPSSDFSHRVADLRVDLLDAVDAEPAIAIAGRYVEFWFGPGAFAGKAPPGGWLSASARRAIKTELLAALHSNELVSGRVRSAAALEPYKLQVHVSDYAPGLINFSAGPNMFAPLGPLSVVLARVTRKIALSRDYDRADPLWLILQITDLSGIFSATVEAFGKLCLDTGSFQRVIVSDGKALRVLESRHVSNREVSHS